MSNFTSKVKGAVNKAASAARDMAQETTNMGDKSMDTQQYEDDSCKVTPEAMRTHKQYGEGHDEQLDKKYDEQYDEQSKDQYDPASQLDMSPLSQESQKLSGSMEKETMCSTAKEPMHDSSVHEDMAKSDMPPSQCMPESGNTAKQS